MFLIRVTRNSLLSSQLRNYGIQKSLFFDSRNIICNKKKIWKKKYIHCSVYPNIFHFSKNLVLLEIMRFVSRCKVHKLTYINALIFPQITFLMSLRLDLPKYGYHIKLTMYYINVCTYVEWSSLRLTGFCCVCIISIDNLLNSLLVKVGTRCVV